MITNRTIQRNANLITRNNKTKARPAIIAYVKAWSMIELVSCQLSVVSLRLGPWVLGLLLPLGNLSEG
jgi:hypothetical protein